MKEKTNLIEFTKSFVEFKVSPQSISHSIKQNDNSQEWSFNTTIPFSYKIRNLKSNKYETMKDTMIVSGNFNSQKGNIEYKKFIIPQKFKKEFEEVDLNVKDLQENLLSELNSDIQKNIINLFEVSIKKIEKDKLKEESIENYELEGIKEIDKLIQEEKDKSKKYKNIFETIDLDKREIYFNNLSKIEQEEYEDYIENKESILISNLDGSTEIDNETNISKSRLEVLQHSYYLLGEKEYEKYIEQYIDNESEREMVNREVMKSISKNEKIKGEEMLNKTLKLNNKIITTGNKKVMRSIEVNDYKKSFINKLVKEGKVVVQNEDRSFVNGTNTIIGFETSQRNLVEKDIKEQEKVKYILDTFHKKSYNLQEEDDIKEWQSIVEEQGENYEIDFLEGKVRREEGFEKLQEFKQELENGSKQEEVKEGKLNKNPSEKQKEKYNKVQKEKEERVDVLKEELKRIFSLGNEEETERELMKFYSQVSKFNNFSTLNIMKLTTQAREQGNMNISYVQSYKKWEEMGVQVNKGTKSMKVSDPKQMYEIERDSEGKPIKVGKGYKYVLDEKGKKIKSNMKFIDVPVFDASQTNAEELGKLPDLGYRNKKENISEEMLDDITYEIAKKFKIKILSKNLNQPNLGGYYSSSNNEIVINNGGTKEDGSYVKSNSSQLGTLFHELGHRLLHSNENYESIHLDKGQKEGEAESISYILSSHVGIEQNSHLYIKGWNQDMENMKQSINKIVNSSREVMNKIDFEKILKEEEQRQIKILEELKLKKEQELENEEELDSDIENQYGSEYDLEQSI